MQQNAHTSALDVLKKHWGYDSFRPVQAEIIESILSGHDTIGLLPTGGGKSLTFQVPALMLGGLTIVVTPLISLMKDQVDNLMAHGIRACLLHSGLRRSETRLALDRCRLGKTPLLYISPERLQSESLISEMRLWDVRLIVVDEAHCISQWGYDFRPSYMNICRVRSIFPDAPTLALTASATPEVVSDIALRLNMKPDYKVFRRSFSRDNISYIVRHCDSKEQMLMRVLLNTSGTAIVYVRSRRRTKLLSDMLKSAGISAEHYHAGLDPMEKTEKQNLWKEGRVRVIVATNAFGMGIDKADVRTVVHYDLPSSLEEYYQEAGRAGRDGLPSFAVVLATPSDKALLTRRLNEAFPPKETILRIYQLLGAFLTVAEGEGYQQVFEFNFSRFCDTYGFKPEIVKGALTTLTQSEYIEYVEETTTRSRVMITANKRELYALQLDKVTDAVFIALQRLYTGMFADYALINEGEIQRAVSRERTTITEQQVYESLLTLSRMHVISYVPRKTTPFIVFPTSLEPVRYVVIPRFAYEERRERMKRRIDSIKAFVYDKSDKCRVRTMLEYFGETPLSDCGKCDTCRAKRKSNSSAPPATSERETVCQIIACQPKSMHEIISLSPFKRERTLDIVRELVKSGVATILADGTVSLISHKKP